jgi:hypothetical protein
MSCPGSLPLTIEPKVEVQTICLQDVSRDARPESRARVAASELHQPRPGDRDFCTNRRDGAAGKLSNGYSVEHAVERQHVVVDLSRAGRQDSEESGHTGQRALREGKAVGSGDDGREGGDDASRGTTEQPLGPALRFDTVVVADKHDAIV